MSMYNRFPVSSLSAIGLFSLSMSFRNLLMFFTIKSFLVSSKWFGKWLRILYALIQNIWYLLHFTHSEATIGIENIFHTPRKGPKDIPLFVFLAFYPTSLFEVLNDCRFVEIGFPTKLLLPRWLHFYNKF